MAEVNVILSYLGFGSILFFGYAAIKKQQHHDKYAHKKDTHPRIPYASPESFAGTNTKLYVKSIKKEYGRFGLPRLNIRLVDGTEHIHYGSLGTISENIVLVK